MDTAEKTARLLFVPLRGRLFRHVVHRSEPWAWVEVDTENEVRLTQADDVYSIETSLEDGQEPAHVVVANVGSRALCTFYDRESGVCGQQLKLHPNSAQEIKVLRPDLFGLAFACAP